MSFDKITGAIIIGVMMVVIVMVVVIPVLDTASTDTATNEPTGYATTEIVAGAYKAAEGGFTIDSGAVIPVENKQAVILTDSFALVKTSDTTLYVLDSDTQTKISVATFNLAADGTYTTYSGSTTYTGSIGDNPKTVYTSGSLGVYNGASFNVNNDQTIYAYFMSPVGGSAEYRAFRGAVAGTPDNLAVLFGEAYDGENSLFVSSGTAEITYNVTEANSYASNIAADPTVVVTTTVNGAEKSYTSVEEQIVFFGPTTYTEVAGGNEAIGTLLGVVPLLMIVGVISMIIAIVVFRP